MGKHVLWTVVILVAAGLLGITAAPGEAGETVCVSVDPNGNAGNGASIGGAVSPDGALVAFTSSATNLVSDDTNGFDDIFIRDLADPDGPVTWRIMGQDGNGGPAQPDGNSGSVSFCPGGQFLGFSSLATNLVAGDSNANSDVFRYDLETDEIIRVSVPDKTQQATQSNGYSDGGKMSADGNRIVFQSYADNLVANDTNGVRDVFVRDLTTEKTIRVSVASDGTQANGASGLCGISADGRFVAFISAATNLVPGDTNQVFDIFVHEIDTGKTTRVSVSSDGTQQNRASIPGAMPKISADGQFVVFHSDANNLVPNISRGNRDDMVYRHDRDTGATTLVSAAPDGSQGNSSSDSPRISADGNLVAFRSWASNLTASDTTRNLPDIYLRDMTTGQTTIVSVASDGTQASGLSHMGSLSPNGRFVTFYSTAANLSPGGTTIWQVYVHDRDGVPPLQISTTSLPDATVGKAYSATVQAFGGMPPYEWAIVEGDLPDGLSLDPDTGEIYGTPTVATPAGEPDTFVIGVLDDLDDDDSVLLELTVKSAGKPKKR